MPVAPGARQGARGAPVGSPAIAADGETPEAAPQAGQLDDHDLAGSTGGQPPPRSGDAPRRPGPRPDGSGREIAARPFPWVIPETRTRPWRRVPSADAPGPDSGSRGGGRTRGGRQPRSPARPEPTGLRYELRSLAELDREVELSDDSRDLLKSEIEAGSPTSDLLHQAGSLWWDQANPLGGEVGPSFTFAGSDDAEQLARPGLEFLSGLQEATGRRPVFDWLDVGLPHQPWRLLPSGHQYNGPESPLGAEFIAWPPAPLGTQLALAARADHLLQLGWTDRFLGAVLDRLAEIDRFDDALVVLTADHGVGFAAGEPIRDLSPGNGTQVSYPPLFVKEPGQTEAAVDDGNSVSLDLLPTVADYAGVEVPWDVLRGPDRPGLPAALVRSLTPERTDAAF